MMNFTRLLILFLTISSNFLFAQNALQSPADFLGYELGDRFTRHHDMRAYYEHVAASNSNVELVEYGKTNEHRPLFVAIISSPENIANLETIRLDNLKRTGLESGNPSGTSTAIVWLSYNVHGNESSSLDASIKTIYELVNPANSETKKWLKNTVVIMDPCINPDGRERYVNHFYEKGNAIMNTNGESKEHREPWPGGRANHYLFDLNRDWAWQTQVESQQRITIYNKWMPHIHVDFHEQSYRNPYYFAPAAKPFHEVITPWQREFQTTIGKNHAKYFDKEGWLYFTKEVFDLLYPSYGDTYPTYNGAIGMTYEQAGGGYSGLGIDSGLGDTLTLKDRLTHHHTTGLSTIEISSINADKLVTEFSNYFRTNSTNPADKYKSYVIKQKNANADKLAKLLSWLKSQQIEYGTPSASATVKGFDYLNNKEGNFKIATNDIVISSYQPKSTLVQALFEPKSKLEDSVTYDITAWAVPYIYGLESYATSQKISLRPHQQAVKNPVVLNPNAYAYVARYESLEDQAFLSAVLQKGIKVRVAKKPFFGNGQSFKSGSLIITRRNNEGVKNLSSALDQLAAKHDRTLLELTTGFLDAGSDLGASSYSYIKPPKVALLGGDNISSLSFGEIWHYFDKEIKYPLTTIYTDYFKSVKLDEYDVLIVPVIWGSWFTDDLRSKISTWVSNGGNLILINNAIKGVADKEGFGISIYASEEEKKAAESKEKEIKKENILAKHADKERRDISNSTNGAIYKVKLDNTHPLAFGYPEIYFTLKTNSLRYGYLENGGNVGVIESEKDLFSGFVGKNIKSKIAESLVFGVEHKGSGNIIYMVDNPLFRDFWENGKLLFGNAVFLVD